LISLYESLNINSKVCTTKRKITGRKCRKNERNFFACDSLLSFKGNAKCLEKVYTKVFHRWVDYGWGASDIDTPAPSTKMCAQIKYVLSKLKIPSFLLGSLSSLTFSLEILLNQESLGLDAFDLQR
jgi:hypothetical protein